MCWIITPLLKVMYETLFGMLQALLFSILLYLRTNMSYGSFKAIKTFNLKMILHTLQYIIIS